MKDDLKGKSAIVTGGTRGIGRAISTALAQRGVNVAFTFIKSGEVALSLSEELKKNNVKVLPAELDVRDFEGCRAFVKRVKEVFGGIDILINNAGITRDKALMLMEKKDWDDVINTNLSGVFNMTRSVIVTFMKQRSGNIVNISSVSGLKPLPRQVNYASSKAGVIGFTKSLAQEVAPYNIRVNAVAPGYIETDMLSHLNKKYIEHALSNIPLGRFGRAEEVAEVVIFLLSGASGYITGQVIPVDGGMSI
ncbi:MAG: 3-oxoacyl-[acyl-carrier-protein] reductase [Nitrospirae bacterium]|nr:MAG: 3-oxoacyl-[acyl-carrier-protein] reductase [Nitrospirota bacterium]